MQALPDELLFKLVPKPDAAAGGTTTTTNITEYSVINVESPEEETGITYRGQTAKIIEKDDAIIQHGNGE